ncbi:MAG: ISL3 family transposase [Actinomycetota bacterium]
MRVTAAFNRMLAIPGATVATVAFTPRGIVVGLRRRGRKLHCPCGYTTRAGYDRSVRRWRHLDLGACRLLLEAEIRRLSCPRCDRVRTEQVPWARPGARLTRDLEDLVAFMAQRMDKTTVARLLRVSWEAVHRAVVRVVADRIDDSRLNELYRIGVDEISYRKGHRYLTVVADHDRAGAVVWAAEGKKAETLRAFYDELGKERKARLQAVSLDMGSAYEAATSEEVPHVRQCIDPFHVVKAANDAIDKTRRWAWNHERRTNPAAKRPVGRPPKGSSPPPDHPRLVKHTRWALLKDPDNLNDNQREVLEKLRQDRSVLYRCWQLKEALRDLYRLRRPQDAGLHLDWWLAWACRSRIPAFVKLSKTIRANRDRILAAVELGLSNSKLEGLNSKIRLINHRGYGHHSATAVIAMIYLCCGGITVQLPTER